MIGLPLLLDRQLIRSLARRPALRELPDKGFVKEYVTPYETPLLET